MARRLFNGRQFSEDGWPYVDQGSCKWFQVAAGVSMQIQEGVPFAVLGAFARDYHEHVEPIFDRDCCSWTPGNSVATSNHPGGTACDIRWDSHPFQKRGSFTRAQLATIQELLDFYELNVFWAGIDWSEGGWGSPIDEMHWQMGYGTYDQKNDRPSPKVLDFVARKIRADGFSTFRRGNGPVVSPPAQLSVKDQHALDIVHEGQRRGISPRGIQIALATALVESNITIYANQRVPESMQIPHEAVGSDAYSVGIFQQQVRNTGNGWWWGDAKTCMDPTLSAGLFYARLVTHDYNGPNSPGSYAQAVQSSAFPDRYDQRFGEAVDLYNRLASLAPNAGDDMASVPQDQWDYVFQTVKRLSTPNPLDSIYADDTNPGADPIDSLRAVNGQSNESTVERLALLGEYASLAKVQRTAQGRGVVTAQWAINRAITILTGIEASNPAVLQKFLDQQKATA